MRAYGTPAPHSTTRRRRSPGRHAVCSSLAALCALALAGCATESGEAPTGGPTAAAPDGSGETGTVQLALTGPLPGIQRYSVLIYETEVTSPQQIPAYALRCLPYNPADNNAFEVSSLATGDNYALLVELFGDDACGDLRMRAYRGGIRINAGLNDGVYYLQPWVFGAFTGMAEPSDSVLTEAQARNCATDGDCGSIHPNAICTDDTKICTIESLFPLNGGSRRLAPSVVQLGDGRVAVAGGLGVRDTQGFWSPASDRVEVFEPATGIFSSFEVANFGVESRFGFATSAALPGQSSGFAFVGGMSKVRLELDAGGLTTAIASDLCGGQAIGCQASRNVWQVDLSTSLAQGGLLPDFLALPVVAPIGDAADPVVLVAGGARLPLPAAGDSRTATATVCSVGSGGVLCQSAASNMTAARADAAFGCAARDQSGACSEVLVVGGRKPGGSGPIAEIFDVASGGFVQVSATGDVPTAVHGARIIEAGENLYLLGGSSEPVLLGNGTVAAAADVAPRLITVDRTTAPPGVAFEAIDMSGAGGADGGQRVLAAAVGFDNGGAMLIGGVTPSDDLADDAILFGPDGAATARIPLERPRLGATAARIGGTGPLGGCVLLVGGLGNVDGELDALSHVEVYCPGG
jgi:hypothetical protein